MSRFSIWLRSHTRSIFQSSNRKTRHHKQKDGKTYTSIRDLTISAPIPVSHNGAAFDASTHPLLHPLPRSNLKPETKRQTDRKPVGPKVPHSIATILESAQSKPIPSTHSKALHKKPVPTATPMIITPSRTATPPPPPPPIPQRNSKRFSLVQALTPTSSHHRPQSDMYSSASETSEAKRMSHYSAMSSGSGSPGARSHKRASVVGGMNGDMSGWEWEERRLSRGFSGRMSWGFEN